jgi:signal transduction histidine kinase
VLLLDNAMKFTHPAEAAGGSNAVEEKASVTLSVSMAEDGMLAFSVEDTGIGVPPEEAEHIFEEFVQLDEYYDGTGIGLTVARSMARRLGGDVWLDTAYTGGARFVFTLPADTQ